MGPSKRGSARAQVVPWGRGYKSLPYPWIMKGTGRERIYCLHPRVGGAEATNLSLKKRAGGLPDLSELCTAKMASETGCKGPGSSAIKGAICDKLCNEIELERNPNSAEPGGGSFPSGTRLWQGEVESPGRER